MILRDEFCNKYIWFTCRWQQRDHKTQFHILYGGRNMHNTKLTMDFSSKKGLAQRNKSRAKFNFQHNSGIWHLKFMASSRTIPRNLVDGIDTSSVFPVSKMQTAWAISWWHWFCYCNTWTGHSDHIGNLNRFLMLNIWYHCVLYNSL